MDKTLLTKNKQKDDYYSRTSGCGGAGAKPVVDGTSVAAGSGTANYGGGGGCFYNKAYAGAGGSGIVIIRNKR